MRGAYARLGAALVVALLLQPIAHAQTSPTPSTARVEEYTVRAGDSLAAIARVFGITRQEIIDANDLPAGQPIRAGQTLIIPLRPDDPVLTTSWTTYTVQRGDTLAGIANTFDTTVDALIALNRLTNPNTLSIGTILRVPQTAPTADPPAPTPSAPATRTVERGVEIFLHDQSTEQLLRWLSELDVQWVKITINWRELEPTPDEIDWSALDAVIDGLNAQSRKLMLTLTGAPDWARPSATDYVLSITQYGPPDDVQTFAQFARRVAARYRGRVQAYEIWVEPNLRRSWLDTTSTSRETARLSSISYLSLLAAAAPAIRRADPNALIISAGLAPTGLISPQNAIADRLFLQTLLAGGLLNLVDAVGVQPDGFANPPDARCCQPSDRVPTHYEQPEFYFLETLLSYRQLINQAGGADMPLWVTRFGWGSAEVNTLAAPNMAENPFYTYTTPQQQLEFTRAAFELVGQLDAVNPMILYNLNGCPARLPEACFYSMLRADGQPGLLYELFRP
ncbi:MAG: LysM peptidoglycan-binding domain-containing protein [Anaerolineae bacterium]